MAEILRLRNDAGPISIKIDSSIRMDGQARLALTAEPPEPKKCNLNVVYPAGQMLSARIWIRVECDKHLYRNSNVEPPPSNIK